MMSIPTTTSVLPTSTAAPGAPAFQEIHATGVRTLWVVTVLMGVSSLIFYILTARTPLPRPVFHTVTALITTISFITYLALATGQGINYKCDEVHHRYKDATDFSDEILRQVLWLRYVNWALTTPLLLTNLALLSGLPGANLAAAIAADWVMLATGLLGTFADHNPQRWVWLVISCFAYLTVLHHAGFHAHHAALDGGRGDRRFFAALFISVFAAFALYPITLATGTLALKISVDVENVLFAVQDIFTQVMLGLWLLLVHDSSSSAIPPHVDGFWSEGVRNEGAIRIPDEEGV